jgi:DNA-binding NarL/FixJ family response regulator
MIVTRGRGKAFDQRVFPVTCGEPARSYCRMLVTAGWAEQEHLEPDCASLRPDTEDQASAMSLTARQQQVVDLLRWGLPNRLIARQLDMTEATVKVHIMRLCASSGRK